jgi:pimeloyl-ACP methyl ester carboxylesterase
VHDFVNDMGIREAPIIGHALGATVALEYTFRHPDRVKKIMAVSLPVTPDCISRKLLDFANNSVIAKMMWWRQISYKEVQKEAEKTGEGAISLSVQSAATIDVKNRIQYISQSGSAMLLAVYGEKDDVIDPSPTRELNGSWPNIRQIGLADSKHFPMLDEAAKFHRLLKDFLEVEQDLSVLELKEEWRRRTR